MRRKRAFTLLELLLSLFIGSLIIILFAMLLDLSFKTDAFMRTNRANEDASLVLSYLSDEIASSDRVYPKNTKVLHRSYQNAYDFILRRPGRDTKYTYIYYALKNSSLYRIALNSNQANINSKEIDFIKLSDKGLNPIADGIKSIDSKYSDDRNLISMEIEMSDGTVFKTAIYVYGGRE